MILGRLASLARDSWLGRVARALDQSRLEVRATMTIAPAMQTRLNSRPCIETGTSVHAAHAFMPTEQPTVATMATAAPTIRVGIS